jgi:hypothetical protein
MMTKVVTVACECSDKWQRHLDWPFSLLPAEPQRGHKKHSKAFFEKAIPYSVTRIDYLSVQQSGLANLRKWRTESFLSSTRANAVLQVFDLLITRVFSMSKSIFYHHFYHCENTLNWAQHTHFGGVRVWIHSPMASSIHSCCNIDLFFGTHWYREHLLSHSKCLDKFWLTSYRDFAYVFSNEIILWFCRCCWYESFATATTQRRGFQAFSFILLMLLVDTNEVRMNVCRSVKNVLAPSGQYEVTAASLRWLHLAFEVTAASVITIIPQCNL